MGQHKMSVLRGLLRNTVLLIVGRLTAKVLTAVFIAFLARAVGPAGVGKYAFAASLIAMFMLLPEFGFDILLVREVSKAKSEGREIVGNILTIKLVLSGVSSFLLISFAALRQYDTQTIEIVLYVLMSAILGSIFQIFVSIFRAFERMEFEALLIVVRNSMMVLIGISAIKLGLTLNGIVFALVISDGLSFLLGMYIVNYKFIPFRPKIAPSTIKKIVKAVIPFGLMGIIEVIFFNTDTLMIAKLEGEMAVGWYSAAMKFLVMVLLIPHMFMNAVFPVLSRYFVSSVGSLRLTYSKSFSYLLMLAFPVAIGGFAVADQIILLIYGEQFYNSILIFQVMIWVVMFSFVGFVNGATLNATGRERLFAVMQISSAGLNIILDYIFIKRFGYIGACYVTLMLTGMGFIIYSAICHRQLSVKPEWSIILKSFLASIIMGSVMFLLKEVSADLFVLIPAGVLVYFGVILLLGTLPREDSRALRNLAFRSPPH